MNLKNLPLSTLLAMMLVMALLVTPSLAQEPDEEREELESASYEFTEDMTARNIGALAAPAAEVLPIQGQLTDSAGTPITGNRSVTFSVYEVATGGTAKCSSTQTVTITEGFFSTEITGCDTGDIRGFQMYMGIKVGSDAEMTPRQPLRAVPYAYSLLPGADLQGNNAGSSMLFVVNFSSEKDTSAVRALTNATGGRTYAVYGRNLSTGGRAVYGITEALTGTTYGMYGVSQSDEGQGVRGWAENSTGNTVGVFGRSSSNQGTGVHGVATSVEGTTYGVYGESRSDNGYGIYGYASAKNPLDTTYGVYGRSEGPTGYGVYGIGLDVGTAGLVTATTTGQTTGLYGLSASDEGRGVYGVATAISGTTYGVYGQTTALTGTTYGLYGHNSSQNGYGSFGYVSALTGTTYGTYGQSDADNGYGVYGHTTALTGTTYGTYGQSDANNGYGVYGHTTALTGTTYGTYGQSDADNGYGVYGHTTALTGTTYGVYGESQSTQGAGVQGSHLGAGVGVMAHSNSGNPIEAYGSVATNTVFKVSNDGDVYADGSYHCGGSITETTTTITGTTVVTSIIRSGLNPCLQDQSEADFAEMLPTSQNALEAGDVLVINMDGELAKSDTAFQPTVVGVYSTKPSYLGNSRNWGQDGYAPLALVGIVPVKVSTENGTIQPGDLLVASDTPGHAMRAGDNSANGTVIGKALMGFEDGTGFIRMLVMLQ
ncbi:hypothetical protein QUF58_00750 [Anaerolineales bacterium HSG24]|nr:hypothetical protein [Anaerolineales bacterium HSG24]